MLTDPWECAADGCTELIHPTGKRGRPALYCPPCIEDRREQQRTLRRARGTDPTGPYGAPDSVERCACGCGRDYMTVPLEDAHRCRYPAHG